MNPKLHIVHCIDTEGPLDENIEATFQRLKSIYNIELEPSIKNLKLIQEKKINLNGLEEQVATTFNKNLLNYNNNWEKIETMLSQIMSEEYRKSYPDSEGNGLIYNWHCLDHVGFKHNPRNRDLGFSKVFNFYNNQNKKYGSKDFIHWHFHPVTRSRAAHLPSTSYDNSYPLIHQIICRRLIDYNWFPIVNRAGFHTIRQDSNFFLEQWIPFDYSNQSTYENISNMNDEINRFGDWRRAPKEWFPYHPSHDDYQLPGSMNRLTTKCLNIGGRYKLLTDNEIEQAFKYAIDNGSAILAYTNHDFRDMKIDIDDIQSRIKFFSNKYPIVKTINSDAVSAIKNTFYKNENYNDSVSLEIEIKRDNGKNLVFVKCTNGNVFGSQPYLAIKTLDGDYYHDNLNEIEHRRTWLYYLDEMTINLEDIKTISVATNDKFGNQSIKKIEL